jgi:hypothetical protein
MTEMNLTILLLSLILSYAVGFYFGGLSRKAKVKRLEETIKRQRRMLAIAGRNRC